jgi:subtilisin family serine protease
MHRWSGERPRRFRVALVALALTTALVVAAAPGAVSASSGPNKVDARVLRAVQEGKSATYWIILRSRADLSRAPSIRDWTARGWFVVNRLQSVADSSQRGLRALLREQKTPFKAFWIVNAIRATSGARTLRAVAARSEVARVVADRSAKVETPVKSADISTIEWNIQRIRAPEVWSTYNDRGEGITVATIDTGAQWNHPALQRQYRGLCAFQCLTANHNYNWYDPSHICPKPAPCDNVSHGTHVLGTIVGDDRGSNQIGVAPRSYWIAAKGCEDTGCSLSALLMSGQWMLAPRDLNDQNPRPDRRPDVINNSWGTGNGSDTFYQATVQAWVASGIFPVFSVGSSGPGCGTASAPATYPESYAVSAFDMNNAIASFASRGPSPFGGIVKPNVTAPGVNIRSSVPNNAYAIFSGTSMATAHVPGTVALIWAGAPSFRRDIPATRAVLDQTAIDVSDLSCGGSPDNNNVWGEGRLDAFAAVTKAKGLS